MRALQCDTALRAIASAILALTTTLTSAALPEPSFNGSVLEDVTRSFSFDRIGTDVDSGPFINKDAYQGTVRSLVIRAPDHTLDFYFHVVTTLGVLKNLSFSWQAPTSFTVAYHVTNPALAWQPEGPSGPAPGSMAAGVRFAGANWTEENTFAGSALEAWFGLDTDAVAYAPTATLQLSDSASRIRGQYSGHSPVFTTFGPAIPEPHTYALMLAGLGLLALRRRRWTS